MENKLERWKMRTEFPAIVSSCSTMKFSNRQNIRTLHPSQADFGCLPERRGNMYAMVGYENRPLGLLSYLNPHKTLVSMVLIEKSTNYKESRVLK